MGRAASPSTGRRYGLARVCRVLETPRSTIYAARTRRLAPAQPPNDGRQTPFRGHPVVEGRIQLGDGPGLGVEPRAGA